MNKKAQIKFTSLYNISQHGARNGVCSLVEVDNRRILLDCGCSTDSNTQDLDGLVERILNLGGADIILISHADIKHMGALPYVMKRLPNAILLCTLPVYKMGCMVLYDWYVNSSMSRYDGLETFSLEDVDIAFESAVVVKYCQISILAEISGTIRHNQSLGSLSACAYPAGRTIGKR